MIILRYFLHFSKLKRAKPSRIWINFAVFGFLISSLIVQLISNQDIPSEYKYIGENATLLVFFCLLFYMAIINRTLFDKLKILGKYKNSSQNDSLSEEILTQVELHMQGILVREQLSAAAGMPFAVCLLLFLPVFLLKLIPGFTFHNYQLTGFHIENRYILLTDHIVLIPFQIIPI